MQILTLENKTQNMNNLPDELEEDIRFAVLDNTNPFDPDFMFSPLIFLETFNSPAVVIEIDGNEMTMPVDWSILVGCSETGADLEMLPITSLNNRGFEAFLYNPLTSFRPSYAKINVINFYSDVKWYSPRTKPGQMLATPVNEEYQPLCAFFGKDFNKSQELVDHSLLI